MECKDKQNNQITIYVKNQLVGTYYPEHLTNIGYLHTIIENTQDTEIYIPTGSPLFLRMLIQHHIDETSENYFKAKISDMFTSQNIEKWLNYFCVEKEKLPGNLKNSSVIVNVIDIEPKNKYGRMTNGNYEGKPSIKLLDNTYITKLEKNIEYKS